MSARAAAIPASAAPRRPLLRIEGLVKRFGGVPALGGVDLAVAPGEVHALLGENGAGKSTLIKCVAGAHRADGGVIEWDGAPVRPLSPREARAMGIAVIHQELQVVAGFTAAEALLMGRPHPATRLGLLDRRAMRERARAATALVAPDLPLDRPLRALSAGQRQMVEIARALAENARFLVLDEPTAALSRAEADRLHAVLARLAAGGTAALYVTHRLADAQARCERATVLRAGRSVWSGPLAGLAPADLVQRMTGEVPPPPARASRPPGEVVLGIDALPFGPGDAPLALAVRAGEVVALYGLVGAGRSALLRCVWGAARPRAPGRVLLRGRPLGGGVRGRIRSGVAYVPEERCADGLHARLSVLDNAALPRLERLRAARGLPWPSRRRSLALLDAVRARFDVRMGAPDAPIESLSGGNQQKVLLGRWTTTAPVLLLLDEPTRGVDPGAKARLHAEIRRLAEEGAAVLAATSDLEEALTLADRVIVMAGGRITAALPAGEAEAARVLAAAFAEDGRGAP